ncbi:MAG: hypothetical protein KDD69_01425 [Bdellovibrionales bacterium]|nr:hypothetical protein [Bdellovibrionales bacterium]
MDATTLDSYYSLLDVEKEHRDGDWKDAFLTLLPDLPVAYSLNLDDSAYVGGHPCLLVYGPQYQELPFDEHEVVSSDFAALLEIALTNQLGVILNPGSDQRADWIFRCGDIECFLFTGKPYVHEPTFHYRNGSANGETAHVSDERQIESGALFELHPLQEFVTEATVQNLFACFSEFGFSDVALAIQVPVDPAASENDLSLVATIAVDDFSSVEEAQACVAQLTWLMPSHVTILMYQAMDEDLAEAIFSSGTTCAAISVRVVDGLSGHFYQESGPSKEGTDWRVSLRIGSDEEQFVRVRSYNETTNGKSSEQISRAIECFVVDELRNGTDFSALPAEALVLPPRYLS